MEPFLVYEANDGLQLKIVCVGIGGAGCNVIKHVFNQKLVDINFIAIDTDTGSSKQINEIKKIQIGSKLLKGLSTNMNQFAGEESALENYNEIKTALDGADMVFILASFGGGTGTGASPVIAKIAKEVGALTISIVTIPFKFEGTKRLKLAEDGLEKIKQESDSVVVIQNENHISSIDKNPSLKNAFNLIDVVMEEVIKGIIGVVLSKGENDINLDFYDLQTVMSHKGMAVVGVGENEGINSGNEAMRQSMEYALLSNITLSKVRGALVHFNVHPSYPIMDISDAMDIINEGVHPDAEVIFGVTTDISLSEEYIKATIILTGCEENYYKNPIVNNSDYEG